MYSNFDYFVFNHTDDNLILKKLETNIQDFSISQDIGFNTPIALKSCEFQFIMVLIKTLDDSIDITNIINNKNNFYYVQNATIFDKNFINWIGINHLKKTIEDVTIILLDNNAQEITLNSTQYIKLETNAYTVMTYD